MSDTHRFRTHLPLLIARLPQLLAKAHRCSASDPGIMEATPASPDEESKESAFNPLSLNAGGPVFCRRPHPHCDTLYLPSYVDAVGLAVIIEYCYGRPIWPLLNSDTVSQVASFAHEYDAPLLKVSRNANMRLQVTIGAVLLSFAVDLDALAAEHD